MAVIDRTTTKGATWSTVIDIVTAKVVTWQPVTDVMYTKWLSLMSCTRSDSHWWHVPEVIVTDYLIRVPCDSYWNMYPKWQSLITWYGCHMTVIETCTLSDSDWWRYFISRLQTEQRGGKKRCKFDHLITTLPPPNKSCFKKKIIEQGILQNKMQYIFSSHFNLNFSRQKL